MKIFFSLLLVTVCLFCKVSAQETDTIPLYKQTPNMPSFVIRRPDSTLFKQTEMPKHRPSLVLYFSPDCGHCQLETEDLISHLKELGTLQVVMVTSRPYEDMKAFADRYKLNRFPAITVGVDAERLVTRFYDVHFTPFSALYGKDGKLVKVYKEGIDFAELAELVKK